MKDVSFYISNCISRILAAPAHINQHAQRERDIGVAVMVAAEEGATEAHGYLVRLCQDAEAGLYTEPREIVPL